MKILVCIKQILDPDIPLKIDEAAGWVKAEKSPVYRMNHFDEYALEEALRIRETIAGAIIDAVSVGPERALSILRRALEVGADNSFLLAVGDDRYLTPYETATAISSHAKSLAYDLILTGIVAEDDLQGQTGPILGALLGVPCATSVIAETIASDCRTIQVVQEREEGRRASLTLTLPALVAVQSGINRPRYPALSHVMRARSREIPRIMMDETMIRPREDVLSISMPAVLKKGMMLEGSGRQKAQRFLEICHEKGLL
jgi:electron transfer flavoprotein beta subunit